MAFPSPSIAPKAVVDKAARPPLRERARRGGSPASVVGAPGVRARRRVEGRGAEERLMMAVAVASVCEKACRRKRAGTSSPGSGRGPRDQGRVQGRRRSREQGRPREDERAAAADRGREHGVVSTWFPKTKKVGVQVVAFREREE